MKCARWLTVVAIVALLAVPATAQEVHVDFDESVDFSQYKTFAWKAPIEASLAEESPSLHESIESAIETQLQSGGLAEDVHNPDLWVTYHASSVEKVHFDTSHMGYEYGPGWGWDPALYGYGGVGGGRRPPPTPTTHTYERGTLIIDIWDAKTNKAIFRGVVEGAVNRKPKRAAKQIETAVEKIATEFASMRAKNH